MSHQPPQQYGEQSPMSQQQPERGQTPQTGQQPPIGQPPSPAAGGTLEGSITDQMRVVLHDFTEAAKVTEWCAERCIDEGPEMAECVRLCRDVADIARLNVELLTRDSLFGPELAEVFVMAADECARECAKHPHQHCQECAEVLPRAARATRAMLSSLGEGQGVQLPASGSPSGGQL